MLKLLAICLAQDACYKETVKSRKMIPSLTHLRVKATHVQQFNSVNFWTSCQVTLTSYVAT